MVTVRPVESPDAARPRPTVSAAGLRQVHRYLLPTERAVILVRRHWAVIAEPILSVLAAFVLWVIAVVQVGDRAPIVPNVVGIGLLAAALRMGWKVLEYRRDWFVVTDERLLLTYGLLTRRVAIMPLTKVTDMSYNVSPLGRLLRYGEFVFESAGQDQALRTVDYLARSQYLFSVLSTELFGESGIASTRKLRRRKSD